MNTPPIENITPSTGRILTEDGGYANVADLMAGKGLKGIAVSNQDGFGRGASYSAQGDAICGSVVDDISVNFQYGISTFDIKSGGTATGAFSISARFVGKH